MRGAERPEKVLWTRPFLRPLRPLSDGAAHQTLIDIADGIHDNKYVDQLLQLTENVPLVLTLIAHLVDFEGCSAVVARWETEKTRLLAYDCDRDPIWMHRLQFHLQVPV